MTKTTTFSVKFSGNFDDYTGPIVSGNDLYRRAMATSPVLFPKYYMPDENHTSTSHILFGNAGDGNYINPYAEMIRGYKQYTNSVISAQAELNQKLDFITQDLVSKSSQVLPEIHTADNNVLLHPFIIQSAIMIN